MKTMAALFVFFLSPVLWAHIPVLVKDEPTFPVQATYLGRGEISRAVYSELSTKDSFGLYVFTLTSRQKATLSVLAPYCSGVPYYETFQPTAILIKGEMPWPVQGPAVTKVFLNSLRSQALMVSESSYAIGKRPINGDSGTKWWEGQQVTRDLEPGLYTVIVWSPLGMSGNYILGLQDKENWTPAVSAFVSRALPQIKKDYCSTQGYSGTLQLPSALER